MWPRSRRERTSRPYADDSHVSDTSLPSHIGRFRLEDQILGAHGQRLWRAYDERLNRMVALRLVDPADPLHDDLRSAACAAARIVDRRVVRVLDVLDYDGNLVIVTEWVDGIPLEQLLTDAMTPAQSVEVTRRVAEAVGHLHSCGLTHGRLRPANVMIDRDGEVRVRGHMIDARIYGIDPGGIPKAADLSGLGAIMTACLTGRWPGETPTALPAVPIVAGKYAVPSQLRADLPQRLDSFVIRAMSAAPRAETLPASNTFADASTALDALAGLYEGSGSLRRLNKRPRPGDSPSDHRPGLGQSVGKAAKRTAVVAGALAAVFAIGVAGARLLPSSGGSAVAVTKNDALTARSNDSASVANTEAESVGESPVTGEQILPIVGIMTMLPKGKGVSAVGQPQFAIDGDSATVWHTALYKTAAVGPTEASGVVIDLGQVRQITAVNIGLLGNNSGVELRVSERLGKKALDYQLLQKVKGASTSITLREARPLATRYLLILLTSVPKTTGQNFQGGISSLQVHG